MRTNIVRFLAGSMLLLALAVGNMVMAQTTGSSTGTGGTGTTVSTPGAPTTGMGGALPLNLFLLASSVLLITGGVAYIRKSLRADLQSNR